MHEMTEVLFCGETSLLLSSYLCCFCSQEADGLEVVGSGLPIASCSPLPDEREDEDEEQKENQYDSISCDSLLNLTCLCLTFLHSPPEPLWRRMRMC